MSTVLGNPAARLPAYVQTAAALPPILQDTTSLTWLRHGPWVMP
jgi:hypothetical protein